MAITGITTGVRLSFGVLVDPLVEAHGWSRGAISGGFTLQFLTAIPVVLVVGRISGRVTVRHIVMAGAVLFALGMILTATVDQAWQFQLYFGVLMGGVGTSAFLVVLPVLLTQWFHKKLGLVMGLMWSSLSWGPALFSPAMRWLIDTRGWEYTFILVGTAGGVAMLLSGLLLKDHPREMGLVPYGGMPPEPRAENTGTPVATVTLRQVMATGSFWSLIAIHTFGCVQHAIPLAHMVSIATFAGIPGLAAAGMLTITAAASLLSRFGMSMIAEARGGRWTMVPTMLIQTLPILLLLGGGELWWFYSFAFFFGIGYGGEMVGFPIFNRQYYGARAPLNAIYSYQMAGALVGMSLGGWLGGALFDWTGAYTWAILVSFTAGIPALGAALLLPRHRSTHIV
ncbi:MAG: MFS transporter [Dehalococcoidia bacterium]|jgi:MFS family permease|nr:MFS transporter [Dehalococcoidia bacterium]MDP6510492.1 MFS transporter [Dehalococcoidia bacterium]